jgi:uncharacterized protein YjbI with pentapeptide repeats
MRKASLGPVDLKDGQGRPTGRKWPTNLAGARLRGAKLAQADLRHVNLMDADLTDADLNGANLTDANLTDTIIDGAQMEKAITGE